MYDVQGGEGGGMPLRVTHEDLHGDDIVRFNGNNMVGSRDAGERTTPRARRSKKITAWRKRKAKEAEYVRRYLS